jgi:hypothetical protein
MLLVPISVKRLSQPQGHTAAGSIRTIENSNDLIGNRTRDLPAFEEIINLFLFSQLLIV